MEKVFVGMCVHRNLRSKVLNLARVLENTKDMEVKFHILDGDALIDRSRSRLATHFLQNMKACKVMVFVDDDIIYEPDTILKQARLVLEKDLPIVGATYVTKNPSNPAVTFKGLDDLTEIVLGEEGVVQEVKYISTGCMAIHRKVFQKMADEGTVPFCHPKDHKFYPFFLPMIYKNHIGDWEYLSEDWAFCQRARDLGFKVYLDCSSKLQHIGDYPYDWDDLVREPKKVNKTIRLIDKDKTILSVGSANPTRLLAGS